MLILNGRHTSRDGIATADLSTCPQPEGFNKRERWWDVATTSKRHQSALKIALSGIEWHRVASSSDNEHSVITYMEKLRLRIGRPVEWGLKESPIMAWKIVDVFKRKIFNF